MPIRNVSDALPEPNAVPLGVFKDLGGSPYLCPCREDGTLLGKVVYARLSPAVPGERVFLDVRFALDAGSFKMVPTTDFFGPH